MSTFNTNSVAESLPNIKGTLYFAKDTAYSYKPTLMTNWAEHQSAKGNQPGASGELSTVRSGYGTVAASNVSSVYKDNAKVQPNSRACRYLIRY